MQEDRPQARKRAAGKIGPWAVKEEPPAMPVRFFFSKGFGTRGYSSEK